MPEFQLRDLKRPDDYPALAEVRNASDPAYPVTPELLAHEDAHADPALYRAQVVAEADGRVVAFGAVGHDAFSFEPWRYWGTIHVHPDFRGRGIGGALYDELTRRLRERDAREIRTGITDRPQDAAGRAFLESRGFRPAWERYESRLHTDAANLGTFDALLASVRAAGIELRSLADLLGDDSHERRLYELEWTLFQDVPLGTPVTKRPYEQWRREELEDPTLRPDLSFVAIDPHREDDRTGLFVGYSTLSFNEAGGFAMIGMTGVLRAYRGRGIAKALKVEAMRALAAAGGGEIRTFNDPPNTAMIGMNRALGFERTTTRYRYELRLDGAGS
ncbi:GNAT family N-acetyltransferase [Deinococcus pimensis]|uniref:GNAT family N-acetyltransferase n=1 Tax=Deinococcus pimensis TaxID=309888 RepID=UPI0004897FCA|nr:GNAT family N-acetyltransferase [Deinococcus pimensis]